jgi:hypothetical protein
MLSRYWKSVAPAVATVAAVGVEWIATGNFNALELHTSLAGLAAATISFLIPNAGS